MANTEEFVLRGPKGFTDSDKRPLTLIISDALRNNGKRTSFIDCTTEEKITYEEFYEQSVALSIAFRELGIKKGDVICLLMENHIKYFITYISTVFSGITVNPLNPEYSDYELDHVLCLARPKVIILSNYTLHKAIYIRSKYSFIEKIINVDPCCQEGVLDMNNLIQIYMNQTSTFELEIFDEAAQDTLILNSSGTTGLPKGVVATHWNIKHNLNLSLHEDYVNMTSNDVVPHYLPCFHILGLFIFISTIAAGGMAILFRKFSLTQLLKSIEKYQVTKLFAVPSIILHLTKDETVQDYNFSSLEDVICAAASLGIEVEKLFISRFGFKIRQIYGLTEMTGGVTGSLKSDTTLSTLGRITPTCLAKVVDLRTNMPLPPLELGELCFSGPMVMKGYYRNPEATKAMIDDDGYLHSGDYGYYDNDGNLYLVDRLKDIIKYKGWQVAPAQIEDLIKSLSDVNDVAVIGKPDETVGEVAMAVIVKKSNSDITAQNIIKFVADNVSVPKRLHGGVVFVDALPKTSSGKVIKSVLKKLFGLDSKIERN